ncbi:MAG: hypothetical protein GC154_00525 [bacterium]|nr:hypothetical protein [bacterium]
MRSKWMLFAVLLCVCVKSTFAQDGAADPGAQVVGMIEEATTVAHVAFLHTNDFQGNFERAGQMEAAIRRLRLEYPDSLLFDAGDFFESKTYAALANEGQAVVDFMNRLGYDGMTLGGNAFHGFRLKDVRRCIQRFQFPVLCANVVDAKLGDPLALPYWTYAVRGARIGVVGAYDDEPLNDAGLHVIQSQPVVEYYAYQLKNKVDLVVALTHEGLEKDKELVDEIPIIDVIIGGSSEDAMTEPLKYKDTLIVQAGSLGRNIGVLELDIDLEANRVASYQGRLAPVEPEKTVKSNFE